MSNNNSGLWLSLVGSGLAADRPAIPNVPKGVGSFWFATDTGDVSSWSGTAWSLVGTLNEVSTLAATGIVASGTHTIAGATPLTAKYNRVTTTAVIGDAVGLPSAVKGRSVYVFNDGAAAAGVYPALATDVIDALAAGAPATVTQGKGALFVCLATGVWTSFGIAAHAA